VKVELKTEEVKAGKMAMALEVTSEVEMAEMSEVELAQV
jgi:hypothetical protein